MPMNFQLDVVSITGKVFSGEVTGITLPGISGEFTSYARHMRMVTPLTTGEVVIREAGKTRSFSIGKGIFAFDAEGGRLLIEDVAAADEISETRVLEAKKRAEELLAKGVSGEEKIAALNQLRRSLVDLKIVRKKRKVF